MDNNVNGQLTCHIQTDLLREDSAPYDFGFEVTCIAEPSPDNGPKRRKVGSLKGFTYFPGSLTRESDLDGAYDLFDSRNDSVLDGYTLLRKRRLALVRAATNGKSTNLKGIRGVVFCEQLFVNPAVRG